MKFSWRKMNIHKKILLLLLTTVMLSFLALGISSVVNMYSIRDSIIDNGLQMGESAAAFTEDVTTKQTVRRLSELAYERAKSVNMNLVVMRDDTKFLANTMTKILTRPDLYRPRKLPVGGTVPIASKEPYVFFIPKLRVGGQIPALMPKLEIASNAADDLAIMADDYDRGLTATLFFASEEGYFISTDIMPKEKNYVEFFDTWYTEEFDPRERIWYQKAKSTGESNFSDVYIGVEGFHCVSCATPYYDENGFAGVAVIGVSLDLLYQNTVAPDDDHTNINFALDTNGKIAFSSKDEGTFAASGTHFDLRKSADVELTTVATNMTKGQSGVATVTADGKEYFLAYAPIPITGWSFGTLIERDKVMTPVQEAKQNLLSQTKIFTQTIRSLFLTSALHMAGIFVLLVVLLCLAGQKAANSFTRPIKALADGVREIATGNLDKKLDIHTGDEIEDLSVCFNSMTDELKTYMARLTRITAERERVQAELSIAAGIQAGLLPKIFPEQREFDIYAAMLPAKNVGGDFYDFYFVDSYHLIVTIADVSGKGVGAAIFMSRSMTVLKNFAVMMQNPDDLPGVLACANKQLCQGNEEDMFVTVFMGMLDVKTGEFIYVNGGHNPPLLRQGSKGTFAYLPAAESCMLGVMEDVSFNARRLKLKPGSLLLLYTDGVTEAMSKDNELFGENRLLRTLNETSSEKNTKAVLTSVLGDIRAHSDGAEQSDDITLLGLKYENNV